MTITVTDNGNGTASISSPVLDEVVDIGAGRFTITGSTVQDVSLGKYSVSTDTGPPVNLPVLDVDSQPSLIWDAPADRVYETGLDRGVLYLPNGTAVPWNGLTSVIESFNVEVSPVYFDGMKISDLVTLGDFEATMKAVTYPDEFAELEGVAPVRTGLFYGDQPPQMFGLCYRTQVGNGLERDTVGYKIHIIYNVTAIPNEKTYATLSADPSLVEFEWNLTAVPEEVPGFRPTAHIIIDSRTFDPWLLEELEGMLYGSGTMEAALLPMNTLVTYINEWYRVKIIDHGDGTWSAVTDRDGFISFGLDDYFSIVGVNAVYLDEDTFVISDTTDIQQVPQILITDNGNGTWTATASSDSLIEIVDGEFTILNATVQWLNPETYRISDTVD
jgi:hypothetical protein